MFIGANVPKGGVQVRPNNYFQGWDRCFGYHYFDTIVIGFSQMHISGTGIGNLSEVQLMPYVGKLNIKQCSKDDSENTYASTYSHDDETAKAGHYQVKLNTYDLM